MNETHNYKAALAALSEDMNALQKRAFMMRFEELVAMPLVEFRMEYRAALEAVELCVKQYDYNNSCQLLLVKAALEQRLEVNPLASDI